MSGHPIVSVVFITQHNGPDVHVSLLTTQHGIAVSIYVPLVTQSNERDIIAHS